MPCNNNNKCIKINSRESFVSCIAACARAGCDWLAESARAPVPPHTLMQASVAHQPSRHVSAYISLLDSHQKWYSECYFNEHGQPNTLFGNTF